MNRPFSPRGRRLARAFGPAAWVVGGQAFSKLLSFGSYYVMVRHLSPEDVGLVALCWVTFSIGETFFDLGLSQAYVRENARDARAESTLFWTVVALAAFWTGICLVVGPLLERAFDAPGLAAALAALSSIYAFKALGWTQLSIQITEGRVAGITARDCIAATVSAGLGIALAVGGAGAWSLVARLVGLAAVASLLTAATTRWRPTAAFDRSWLRRSLRFGLPVTAAGNVHWLVVLQFEGYIVTHALGLHALGLLQFAKKPPEVLAQLMVAVQKVHLLREFSAVRRDRAALRAALVREAWIYLALGVAVAAASNAFAWLVIETVWGRGWAPAVPLVALMSIAAPFITLQAVAISGLTAAGGVIALFRANLASAAFTCLALAIAAPLGLLALGVAQALALTVGALLSIGALLHHLARTRSAGAPVPVAP